MSLRENRQHGNATLTIPRRDPENDPSVFKAALMDGVLDTALKEAAKPAANKNMTLSDITKKISTFSDDRLVKYMDKLNNAMESRLVEAGLPKDQVVAVVSKIAAHGINSGSVLNMEVPGGKISMAQVREVTNKYLRESTATTTELCERLPQIFDKAMERAPSKVRELTAKMIEEMSRNAPRPNPILHPKEAFAMYFARNYPDVLIKNYNSEQIKSLFTQNGKELVKELQRKATYASALHKLNDD
jgi:hypothetical protein